jgi:hypothetical protein
VASCLIALSAIADMLITSHFAAQALKVTGSFRGVMLARKPAAWDFRNAGGPQDLQPFRKQVRFQRMFRWHSASYAAIST